MRLIDADMFKKSIEKDCENAKEDFTGVYREIAKGVMKGFLDDIDEQPTVEPKRGEWIYEDVDLVCSVCGTDAPIIPFKGKQYKANFCANCGADMRGEK